MDVSLTHRCYAPSLSPSPLFLKNEFTYETSALLIFGAGSLFVVGGCPVEQHCRISCNILYSLDASSIPSFDNQNISRLCHMSLDGKIIPS